MSGLFVLPSSPSHLFNGEQEDYSPVPLIDQTISIEQRSFAVIATLRQKYLNINKEPVRVFYRLRAPKGATATKCEARIQDSSVETKACEAESAETEYENAQKAKMEPATTFITHGTTIAMMIGYLPQDEACVIQAELILKPHVTKDQISVNVPLSMLPQRNLLDSRTYQATGVNITHPHLATLERRVRKELAKLSPWPPQSEGCTTSTALFMDIRSKYEIYEVSSTTHGINGETFPKKDTTDSYRAAVGMSWAGFDLKNDISITTKLIVTDMAEIFMEECGDGSVTALMSYSPRIEPDHTKLELIFLVDLCQPLVSDNIVLIKQALHLAIASLPLGMQFNMTNCQHSQKRATEESDKDEDFKNLASHQTASLFESPREVQECTIKEAKSWIDNLTPTHASGDFEQLIQSSLRTSRGKHHPRQILAITGAALGRCDTCSSSMETCHGPNRMLLLNLEGTPGACTAGHASEGPWVSKRTAEENGNLIRKILELTTLALRPCIYNINLSWEDCWDMYGQVPSTIQPLYSGSRTLMLRKWDRGVKLPESVTLTAVTSRGDLMNMNQELDTGAITLGNTLSKVHASALMQDLTKGVNSELNDSIMMKEISHNYNVGSPLSINVSIRKDKTDRQGRLVSRQMKTLEVCPLKKQSDGQRLGTPPTKIRPPVSLELPPALEIICQLAKNQLPSGAFPETEGIWQAINLEDLMKLQSGYKMYGMYALTAVVIATARIKFSQHKNLWEAMIKKSIDWLNNQDLIDAAATVVSQGN